MKAINLGGAILAALAISLGVNILQFARNAELRNICELKSMSIDILQAITEGQNKILQDMLEEKISKKEEAS